MDATSTLIESLTKTAKKRVTSPLIVSPPPVAEKALEVFFDDSPQSQTKPQLPEELMPFWLLHRHATTGSIPAEKANEVIETIHKAADLIEKGKKGLLYESLLEQLQELDDWLMELLPTRLKTGEDPFEGI